MKRLLGNCIVFEYGRLSITKKLKGMLRGCGEDVLLEDSIELSHIWTALVGIGSAEESVGFIVENIWQYLLRPLWKERRPQTPHSFTSEDKAELIFDNVVRDYAMSAVHSSGDKSDIHTIGASRMPFPQLLEQISQILTFMWTEIFCGNEDIIRLASVKFFGGDLPSSPLIDTLIDTLTCLMPKNEGELTVFTKSIEKPCKDFEVKLLALGLYPSIDRLKSGNVSIIGKKPQSLSDVVVDMNSRFAEVRRKEILGRGRDLLLSDYHNTMLAGGDATEDDPASAGDIGDPSAIMEHSGSFSMQALQFENCQVSLAACRILKLVHDVMKQACASSPCLAAMLYQSARDCFELFMAIIPVRFADVIDTVPRMGAVLYNDSCYIAHNCTLITHFYKEELGKIDISLQNNCGFIDFIPRIRAMGEKCLSGHVEEQRATLSELVTRINLNPANDAEGRKNTSRNGLVGAVGGALLKNIGGLGGLGDFAARSMGGNAKEKGVLSTDRFLTESVNDEESAGLVVRHLERLMGQWQGVLQEIVYDRVIGYLLEDVLRAVMRPILETDCVTESAGGDISRVFRTVQRARSVFIINGSDNEAVCKIVPSWSKFCALTDLLEYSLSEVAEWLPRRKFSSFTGSEMNKLIKALFEDSPRRKGILNSILEMTS
eukprot:CAMPEP_0119049468 /NCGR_PEP_ID=MMETSP1177-20130426/64842_1 /TAXON_ID=2985 /ORGANISM="Ochromonas sp, Strain CCMP1899" /LENGTH=658 /DNA_ID=CAMNT_0007026749 /DNA_START=596 /DNA_END=2572 /DNA_ORIENTATION=-